MKHLPSLLLLLLLAACGESHEQMLLQLEELERQNRAYSVMRNDSLALRLVDYFDRHGSSNERLRAHYILGRTYADLGEAPAAISAYLDAADCADTTQADCDYRTLGCVYSQMGNVFHLQLLLTDEIEARQKSYQYALLAGDTLGALSSRKLSAGAYLLLGEESVAESILLDVLPLYEKYGYVQQGIQSSLMLMYIYVNYPEHASDLANLIRRYDTESTLFDKEHELSSQKRIYYYYKGKYFENVNQLDSAELYYRKVYYPDMAYVAQNSMYGGLLSVFQKRHQADSIAKYAQLYCQANDSSIALNDQQLTAKLAASYQYNRIREKLFEGERKAGRDRFRLYLLLTAALLSLLTCSIVFSLYRRRRRQEIERLKSDYAEAARHYNENLHAISLLEDTHKQVVSTLRQELLREKTKSVRSEERLLEVLSNHAGISGRYETDVLELRAENQRLQETINQLRHCKDLSPYVENSQSFLDSNIVVSITENARRNRASLTDDDWNELVAAVSRHFPAMLSDLQALDDITTQKMRLCLLSILPLRASDVAHFLGVSLQRLSNLKSELNAMLFGESTARTLSANLSRRYDVMV